MSQQPVCLLTGATSGIGQAAAIELAAQGYSLSLVARNKDKAVATEALIRQRTPDATIDWLHGDLASLADVRAMAQGFLDSGKSLDLLFNNAGVTMNSRRETVDGFEMMFGVNHLAPFLLTNLLLDRLVDGDTETRVVTTSSGAHKFVKALNIDDLNYQQGFKTFPSYGNSKLCNILFTIGLAERLAQRAPEKSWAINCFHPGFVGTNLGTDTPLGKAIMTLIRPFARSGLKGAETGLFLATDPSVAGNNGGYYYDCKQRRLDAHATDPAMVEQLWDRSAEMAGL